MNILMIWNQFKKAFGFHIQSGQSPIFRNHLFAPSCFDQAFCTWSEKGLTTLNYLFLNGVFSSFTLRAAWNQDLGAPLSDVQWEEILNNVHSSSICARHSLLQCKILHRAYLTNAKLDKFYSATPGLIRVNKNWIILTCSESISLCKN